MRSTTAGRDQRATERRRRRRAIAAAGAADRARRRALVLLLDYDGCLVPFAPIPELARPDAELLALLRALAARPRTEVHIVSGRKRDDIRALVRRAAARGCTPSTASGRVSPMVRRRAATVDAGWKERVLPILLDYADRTPGRARRGEARRARLALSHGRSRSTGPRQANELRKHLTELLSNMPVEILPGHAGHRVATARRQQGAYRSPPSSSAVRAALIVAFGDDATDEDMFAALPPSGISYSRGQRR